MIKFKYAIHKATGIKVRYDEWLELHKNDKTLRFIKDEVGKETESYVYKAKDILFSDDFEFVYDDGFTDDELYKLMSSLQEHGVYYELFEKVESKYRDLLRMKYRLR